MAFDFEEIDRRPTPIGEVSVRRRTDPALDREVYEVKLGDEFLMSSLFTVSESELARLALAELPERPPDRRSGPFLDVVVGGLGLGYTTRAVLEDPRVRSVHVVEALGAVIEWHEEELLPLAPELVGDPRCHLVHGDFFRLVEGGAGGDGFGPHAPERWHAVLVDIDHSPRHLLDPSHASFYGPEGLRRLADRLHPAGVFGLWSDDAPDDDFRRGAEEVFASCEAHVVTFPNPITGGASSSTVYVTSRPRS